MRIDIYHHIIYEGQPSNLEQKLNEILQGIKTMTEKEQQELDAFKNLTQTLTTEFSGVQAGVSTILAELSDATAGKDELANAIAPQLDALQTLSAGMAATLAQLPQPVAATTGTTNPPADVPTDELPDNTNTTS